MTSPRIRRPWLTAAVAAPLTLIGALVLASCTGVGTAGIGATAGGGSEPSVELATVDAVDAGATAAEVMADNEAAPGEDGDDTWSTADEVAITLSGSTARVGSGANADAVSVADGTVTIGAAGTYRLTGDLDGQVVVDVAGDDLVRLVLDGVEISSDSSAAIAVTAAGRVQVVLADGSSNTLADTASYDDGADVNAALFSATDLVIAAESAGTGELTVHGNGNDGIASKDGLRITGGAITVDAVDDGIRGRDEVQVDAGTITVTAGGDGLKADNEEDADRGYLAIGGGDVSVDAGGDGLDAATDVVVWGGSLDVTSGGGHEASIADGASAKGLKGRVYVVVDGGSVTVDAAEDAIHTDNSAHLAEGVIEVAAGDDGVHADVALTVSGGTVDVISSYEGLEGSAISISGGRTRVAASDDGVNVSAGDLASTADALTLAITGGTLEVDADGDGIDVNGSVSMSGGTVTVQGPTANDNAALDYDGTFDITGGTLMAVGSAGMAMAPGADASQASVLVALDRSVPAGTELQVTAADGTPLGTVTTAKQAGSVTFSSPELENGQTYSVTADGARIGSAVAGEQVSTGMPGGGPGGGGAPGGGAPRGGSGTGGGQPPARP
ncbi:carbohydrate-binding domain-containing protein [Agromyces intestinalis]|uniref:Carbohydrate-binding domain-containing protein n=1 Tax=Agromyces intestinalis TaxID=2592652 RepID=A0A5C1YJ90_9MICO|nr:carbohydrate-binding domain-containing protein [Agromyces intestinalis]QEO14862.1 carbohydrate-binding domain-containing protein [Agromyces intestinalis]